MGLVLLLFSSTEVASDEIERIKIIANQKLISNNQNRLINSDLIDVNQHHNATKITEIITRIPGLSLNGQGGLWQTCSIRGFSRWRVQNLLSGIPIITDRRAGNSLSFFDPSLIATIDVIKGPASTFFGSGSIGGVINIEPIIDQPFKINSGFNSFGEEVAVSTTGTINDVSAGLAYRKSNNGKSANQQLLNSMFEQWSGILNYSTLLNNEVELALQVIPTYGKNIGKPNRDYPTNKITIYPEEKHLLSKVSLSQLSEWQLMLYTHQQSWQSSVLRIGKRTNNIDYAALDWGGNWQQQWQYAELVGHIGIETHQRTNVKIKEVEYDLLGQINRQQSNLTADEQSYSIFVDGNYIIDSWIFNTGIRSDWYQQSDAVEQFRADHITGFANISYQFNESLLLQAQWGTGFRFPSLTERFYQGTTGRGVVEGNLLLQPELASNIDLGMFYSSDNWQLKLNLFSSDVSDYIERVVVGTVNGDDLLTYINLTSGTIKGAEIAANWNLNQRWLLDWSLQIQEGKDQQGNYLSDIPAAETRFQLNYQTHFSEHALEYIYRFTKGNYGSGEEPLAHTQIININNTFEINDNLVMSLSINNLTDQQYYPTADDLASMMPGREFNLAFEYSFD